MSGMIQFKTNELYVWNQKYMNIMSEMIQLKKYKSNMSGMIQIKLQNVVWNGTIKNT